MSIGTFTDKAHPPTTEQIRERIGPKSAAWEELTCFVRDRFKPQGELRFYGKNYGWACRFRKSGKALASFYPADDGFTVQIVLSPGETRGARALRLGKRTERIIDEAHAYPEGRWLFIPIKSAKDVDDVKHLLMLKRGSRGAREKSGAKPQPEN